MTPWLLETLRFASHSGSVTLKLVLSLLGFVCAVVAATAMGVGNGRHATLDLLLYLVVCLVAAVAYVLMLWLLWA